MTYDAPKREPFRCPTCGRVFWTRAWITYCYGGQVERHDRTEMDMVLPADVPAADSPDIVTT